MTNKSDSATGGPSSQTGSRSSIDTADALAGLLTGDTPPVPWSPDDRRLMLRHQFSAPIDEDLGEQDERVREYLLGAGAASFPAIRSIRDVLLHPSPPPWLLDRIATWGREQARGASEVAPEDDEFAAQPLTPIHMPPEIGEAVEDAMRAKRGIDAPMAAKLTALSREFADDAELCAALMTCASAARPARAGGSPERAE